MKKTLVGLVVGALMFGSGVVGARVVYVTNPMTADLQGGGHDIADIGHLSLTGGLSLAGQDITGAHDIASAGGAVIEMNTQGDLSMYSSPTAIGAYVAADGGSGALVFVHGSGSGTPGDVWVQPDGSGNLRLFHIPTVDPGVLGAVWSDGGTLKVSGG